MAKKFDFLSPGVEIREIDQSFIPAQAEAEGPIIIGRTRKGPANKPVRVRNLDDFVSVFGLPVAGGNGTLGDIWREGNTVGPTYASYAAQAWLASENSPVTVVRMAGEQHSSVGSGGEAGWQVGSNAVGNDGNNSTAYGLFVLDEADAADAPEKELTYGSHAGSAGQYGGDELTVKRASSTKVVFTFNNASSSANGTAVKGIGTAIALHINGLNATQIMSLVETGFALAKTENLLSDFSIDNSGGNGSGVGNGLKIFNLSTSENLSLICSDADSFQLDAAALDTERTIAAATTAASNGSLAAVLYCVTGALALSGNIADAQAGGAFAGALIESVGGDAEFNLKVYNAAGTETDSLNFNFDRNSGKYIRNVLCTNPQLSNSTTVDSADLKTYWLGESFADHLESNVTLSGVKGTHYAILLPLGIDDTASKNWGYHRYSAREAKSGWVFSDRSTQEKKLFRFKSLHVGEDIQRNYVIAIEDIKLASNASVNAYGSFTVCFKDIAGNTVER